MNHIGTQTSSLSLDDARLKLNNEGFALLVGMCEAGLITRLLEVSLERGRAVTQALGARAIGIGSAAGFHEIVQRSPGRWDIPISPTEFGVEHQSLPWWPLIADTLGTDAEHAFSGVVYSDPGSPAQCWHIDSPHVTAKHQGPHALNIMVALHDISLAMGPTELASGSHRLTNHLHNSALVSDKLVYQHETTCPELLVAGTCEDVPEQMSCPLIAGSCLVFDDRLLHRGMGNGSTSRRSVAYFSYRRADYCENTHFESQRSIYPAQG
ncbi:phytanoyl-CoA dioxygenase family protein [Luminiphilus sp.]|nr:phytanoyl-CoA dioxygenase family protein [Luminiphilus sp.]